MLIRLRCHRLLGTLIAVCCLSNQSASAQFGGFPAGGRPGTVSGTGVSELEKLPGVMRIHLDLEASAGSLKEAIEVLKTQKESARQALEKLAADMDSVKFGQTSISDAQSEQQQQMAQMMAMIDQQRGRTGRANPSQTAVPVTVSCSLTAEWKLAADFNDDLLLIVHPLQQKILAADLSGTKNASALTPEQEELLEEIQGEFPSFPSGESSSANPVFMFVATITEEEHQNLLAEAFQEAKTRAARLSRATGAELGPLVSVTSGEEQPDLTGTSSPYELQLLMTEFRMMQATGATRSDVSNEAISYRPGPVKKRLSVTAWFDFKE